MVMKEDINHFQKAWLNYGAFRFTQENDQALTRYSSVRLTFAVQDLPQCPEQKQGSIFPSNGLLLLVLLCQFGLLPPLVRSGNGFAQRSPMSVLL